MPKKPAPKTAPKPDLTYVPDGELPRLYLCTRDGLWRAKDGTYGDFLSAGTFTQVQADEIHANEGDAPISVSDAARDACRMANPIVLAAIAALGGR